MEALSGDLADRAHASLAAGCDVVLHCNGSMAEMSRVVSATGGLEGKAARRAQAALAALPASLAPFDRRAARARLDLALTDLAA
jgi:beta-N-acetylhexosaminidase